jgi:hypothetical protein
VRIVELHAAKSSVALALMIVMVAGVLVEEERDD